MAEPHLDDDRVSELIDADLGIDTDIAAARAHVEGCDQCRARVRAFAGARDLINSPVAPQAARVVDAMIAVAVGAGEETRVTSGRVVTMPRRRISAPPPAWLAAVAAALVLLLAVPALMQAGGDGDDAATVAQRSTDAFSATDNAAGGAGAAAGDEQEESDTADFAATTAPSIAAAPITGGAVEATSAPSLGAVDDSDDLVRKLVAVMSTDDEAAQRTAGSIPCGDVARDVGGSRLGSLTYAAGLLWRGDDAVVVVFTLTEPSGGDTRQAYVMARAGCAVLAEPRF